MPETPITPTQQLDVVLYISSLSNNKNARGFYQYMVDNYNWDIPLTEIKLILERLHKDGYLTFDSQFETGNITFDGKLFLQTGGYTAKASRDEAAALSIDIENQRKLALDNNLEANSTRLNRLTLWLAVGTIALALIEIIKFFVWLSSSQKSL